MSGAWMTTGEVAARWRMTPREVQRMVSEGYLEHMRVGRTGRAIRISESAVQAWERMHTSTGRARR